MRLAGTLELIDWPFLNKLTPIYKHTSALKANLLL